MLKYIAKSYILMQIDHNRIMTTLKLFNLAERNGIEIDFRYMNSLGFTIILE